MNLMKDIRKFDGAFQEVHGERINAAAALSIGSRLREIRLQRGISLREIANETRIGIHSLEAIESGNFHQVPQGVYLRSFIRKYARCLQIDHEVEGFLQSLYSDGSGAIGMLHVSDVHYDKDKSVSIKPVTPRLAEYILYLFLTKAERIYLIGDLNEEYYEVAHKFGPNRAKLWFYKQVLSSLTPLASRSLRRLKVIVSLAELFRRLFS